MTRLLQMQNRQGLWGDVSHSELEEEAIFGIFVCDGYALHMRSIYRKANFSVKI